MIEMGSRSIRWQDTIKSVFKLNYDKKETYVVEFSYTIASPIAQHNEERVWALVVVQKTIHSFNSILCRKKDKDPSLVRRNQASLEGVDFEKTFNIYGKEKKDAFYVLNPRLMDALLRQKRILFFETFGDYIAVAVEGAHFWPSFSYDNPPIYFDKYQMFKKYFFDQLDIATDINHIISRQIVGDGSGRSEAKIVS